MAFGHRLWHSSWGGEVGRRMFTFNWASCPKQAWEEGVVPYSTGVQPASAGDGRTAPQTEIAKLVARIQEKKQS